MSANQQNEARDLRAEQRALVQEQDAIKEELRIRLLRHIILCRCNATVPCDDGESFFSDQIYKFEKTNINDGGVGNFTVTITRRTIYNENTRLSKTVFFKEFN